MTSATYYPYYVPKKLCTLCRKPITSHPNPKTSDNSMNPEKQVTTTSPHPHDADRTWQVLPSAFGGFVSDI